jgi:hypothetical protein
MVEALNEPWMPPEERRRIEEAKARQQAEEEARQQEMEAERRADEEEYQRHAEAQARKRAEEEARRLEAETKRRAEEEQRSPNALSVRNQPGRWRVRAAIELAAVTLLLLIGVGSYAFIQKTGTIDEAVRQPSFTILRQPSFTIRRGMEASIPFTEKLSDQTHLPLASIGECEQKCAQHSTCNVFTYKPGSCYLYTRANLAPNADFDSGVRN